VTWSLLMAMFVLLIATMFAGYSVGYSRGKRDTERLWRARLEEYRRRHSGHDWRDQFEHTNVPVGGSFKRIMRDGTGF